jgi:tetratricopeptide (TPR) repeat protein
MADDATGRCAEFAVSRHVAGGAADDGALDAAFRLHARGRSDCDRGSRVISTEPGRAAAYRLRGSAFLRKRVYLEAIADLSMAVELAPADAVAYYLRGRAWQLTKNPTKAVADFDQAIKLKPDYLKAFQAREAAMRDQSKVNVGQQDRDAPVEQPAMVPNRSTSLPHEGLGAARGSPSLAM